MREDPLQHRQAAYADDGLQPGRLDYRGYRRGAFGDEDDVSEPLGLAFELVYPAGPAVAAVQAELVKGPGACSPGLFGAEALGEQQQPAVERRRRDTVSPDLVVQQHNDVVAVRFVREGPLEDAAGVHVQLAGRQRGRRATRGDIVLHRPGKLDALGTGGGNLALRRSRGRLVRAVGHGCVAGGQWFQPAGNRLPILLNLRRHVNTSACPSSCTSVRFAQETPPARWLSQYSRGTCRKLIS